MGSFHMGQVVFGVDPAEVRLRIVRWLGAKGFELQPGEPLVGLHPKHERGLLLKVRGDTTIVLYSELMEQQRLLYELQRVGRAVLDTWMHDSDVWGYQLYEGRTCTSAFTSNPRYFGAAEPAQGPDDLGAVARVAGVEEGVLRKARRKRALFAEGLNERFLAALGARGAATRYRYHQEDGMRPALDAGFEVEHLWFRKAGIDPLVGFDVTELDFAASPPQELAGAAGQLTPEQLAEVEAMQAKARRRMRLMSWLFWPVGLVLRVMFAPWIWWNRRQAMALLEEPEDWEDDDEHGPAMARVDSSLPPSPVEELPDGGLRDPRLGATVLLPDGAERRAMDRLDLGASQPFACHLGEQRLLIRAVAVDEIRNQARFSAPNTQTVQELDFAGERPLKIVKQRFGAPHDGWRCMALVKGPQAVFLGETGGQGAPPVGAEEALVDFVRSLRFEGDGAG